MIDTSLLTAADLKRLPTGHFAAAAPIERDPDFAEGKAYLTMAHGSTGGRHCSVYVAERPTERLCQSGLRVEVAHRDLPPPRAGPAPALPGDTAGGIG